MQLDDQIDKSESVTSSSKCAPDLRSKNNKVYNNNDNNNTKNNKPLNWLHCEDCVILDCVVTTAVTNLGGQCLQLDFCSVVKLEPE